MAKYTRSEFLGIGAALAGAFSFGRPDAVHERFSVEVGAVRFTERFGLAGVTPLERLEAATARIAAELGRLAARTRPDAVVGMGGAVTNLAAVLHGLAVQARDGASQDELLAAVCGAMAAWDALTAPAKAA